LAGAAEAIAVHGRIFLKADGAFGPWEWGGGVTLDSVMPSRPVPLATSSSSNRRMNWQICEGGVWGWCGRFVSPLI
jgi:hypothetical protein